MRQVVLISGHLSVGKSGLARLLNEEFGYHWIRTSELLKGIAISKGQATDRSSLQRLGDSLDSETDHRWVVDAVLEELKTIDAHRAIVVDSIRTPRQLHHFRCTREIQPIHVHLFGTQSDLERRFKSKLEAQNTTTENYSDADLIKSEQDIVSFKKDADVRINTTRNDDRDILSRVAARLGLYSAPDVRCVDVLVGGQYGSEGKGHVAAYLAKEYDILVRVGGPNAGHTVSGPSGVYT